MATRALLLQQEADIGRLKDALTKEAGYWHPKRARSLPEKKWFNSVRKTHIFSVRLIDMLLAQLDGFADLSDEEVGFIVGKVAITDFLDVINIFEQHMMRVSTENEVLAGWLDERIDKRVKIVEESWTSNPSKVSGRAKSETIRAMEMKRTEASFIRDTLLKNQIISSEDHALLSFVWDIRNSIHRNFCAIKDIEFEWDDQKGHRYSFNFKKGDELSHPDDDLMAYFSITERMTFIFHKVLSTLPDA